MQGRAARINGDRNALKTPSRRASPGVDPLDPQW
jgi:hypothetical protein